MRHATAKFGFLVHRFGMISIGLHAREIFEIDFWSFLDPKTVVCLIHLLTQRSRNLALKTRSGLVISIFTRRRVSAYFFFVHW